MIQKKFLFEVTVECNPGGSDSPKVTQILRKTESGDFEITGSEGWEELETATEIRKSTTFELSPGFDLWKLSMLLITGILND